MPRVSMFVISSAKIQTSPSTSLGLKRYMFPFSAVNSAIAQPAFVTLTPSALIALLVSLATRVISGLSEYAPILSCMRATSLCAEAKPDKSKVFLTPVLPVTSKTFSSVSVALTLSAPAVAVSAALMALFVLSAAVLAAVIDVVRALRSILSSLPLSEGDIKPALPGDIKGLLFSLSLNSELERDVFVGAVASGTIRYLCEPSANSILIAVSDG